MFTMFIRHKVKDYAQWRRAYDAGEGLRKEHGITGASIHRDIQDANNITVTHRTGDLAAALALANSEELKSRMAEAGVIGPPDIWFTEDVERVS